MPTIEDNTTLVHDAMYGKLYLELHSKGTEKSYMVFIEITATENVLPGTILGVSSGVPITVANMGFSFDDSSSYVGVYSSAYVSIISIFSSCSVELILSRGRSGGPESRGVVAGGVEGEGAGADGTASDGEGVADG